MKNFNQNIFVQRILLLYIELRIEHIDSPEVDYSIHINNHTLQLSERQFQSFCVGILNGGIDVKFRDLERMSIIVGRPLSQLPRGQAPRYPPQFCDENVVEVTIDTGTKDKTISLTQEEYNKLEQKVREYI